MLGIPGAGAVISKIKLCSAMAAWVLAPKPAILVLF